MDDLATTLARSPELFPFALDLRRGTVALIRLTRSDYEKASFLDGRIADASRPARQLPLTELVRAVEQANLGESCDFIFHIGHVGSTLLSRLLGQHPAFFSLREPEVLRTLAQVQDPAVAKHHLPVFLKLWSRTFDPGSRALVKATSFVSDLADALLARAYRPKALLMGVAPETYLATIFGGENAPREAQMLAPFRLARLRKRLGCNWRLDEFDAGTTVALGWACETLALADALSKAGSRVRALDFDRFLGAPHETLAAVFRHFDVATRDSELDTILASPQTKTYSKAPEFPYDAALRRAVLDQGRMLHAAEIRQGLVWLDRVAREFPALQNAFALFNK